MFAALLSFGVIAGGPRAHPLHTTMTEIVESEQTVSVTVRGFQDDLTLAATHRSGGSAAGLSLGRADSLIAAYAGASFSLEDPGGHPLPLHFTGIRRTGDVIWVSFETQHRDLSGARVCSRMLWEIYPDQVNIVQARYSGKNRSLLFTPGDGVKRLP